VQRISDLCTADGVFILPSISKGERSIRQCASKLGGIRQERPGESTWTIWTRFLNTICKNDNENKKGNNNNDNDKNRKQDEEKEKFSMGTIITKYWNGVPYTGIVIDNTGKYYKIRYNDNDEEELNHTEVQKYRKKNRGEGRMTGEIGQRMRLRRPLGEWTILANESDKMWPFYYSHDTDTLYRSYREEQGTSKNQKQQHEKLISKSGQHNRKLACSAMSPKCAWVHYTAIFQSSVGYPLSMCHLSQRRVLDGSANVDNVSIEVRVLHV
jgi:hypothetical protein